METVNTIQGITRNVIGGTFTLTFGSNEKQQLDLVGTKKEHVPWVMVKTVTLDDNASAFHLQEVLERYLWRRQCRCRG